MGLARVPARVLAAWELARVSGFLARMHHKPLTIAARPEQILPPEELRGIVFS
jgi:hypothetical protein